MRIAAGILMIILGTITGAFVAFVEVLLGWGDGSMNYASFILFAIIPAVFVIPGGVFCLKRKYWKLCVASSLLLLVLLALLLLILWVLCLLLPPHAPVWWMAVPIPVGTLPIVFVCLRRREWRKSQA